MGFSIPSTEKVRLSTVMSLPALLYSSLEMGDLFPLHHQGGVALGLGDAGVHASPVHTGAVTAMFWSAWVTRR